MSMLENIRQIGIFMIIAQTVMHFAAGKQYEKYMKIITGVIILALFISPYVSGSENITAKWQEEAARMMEQIEERSEAGYQMSYVTDPAQAAVLQQVEEEIKSRLNAVMTGRSERVTEAAVDLRAGGNTGQPEDTLVLERVRVTVQILDGNGLGRLADTGAQKQAASGREAADTGGKGMIRVEEIIVGTDVQEEESTESVRNEEQEKALQPEKSAEQNEKTEELRQLFAQTLGMTEDKVEVVYLGEW